MKLSLLIVVAVVCFVGVPAFAQSGCVDSPENPTALLALVGSASAFAAVVRSRCRRK
jgi:XrtJ-associated TM-motif-TM protein